jgi:competence protein ComEC
VLHKEIPFLRIIIPLCLGIISCNLVIPGKPFFYFLIITGFSVILFSIIFNNRLTHYIFGIAVFIGFYSIGIILATNEISRISTLESRPAIFITTLSDYPVEKEQTFMVTVELEEITSGGLRNNVKGSLMLYHRKDSLIKTLKPGDIIIFRCSPVEITNRGNPYEFDYKSYMLSKGIRYYAYTGKTNILATRAPDHRKLKHIALITRERIIKMYEERGVTGERLALASAITLGQKNLLDPEAKQIFINAGVMHIMAVSGLHVVILSLFILKVLFFMKKRFNILRIFIAIALIWAFAFVTGLSPSVLRATLMFTFLQAGNILNRKVNGINSLLASAFFLIVMQPSVIADAGFLLSYAAVIYIIGFYNTFYHKIQLTGWLADNIWQSVAITLVAQAGTLPLTIMLFNRFPVYFILTNAIIVPLSNLLIIVGCLVPLTYPVVPVSEFLASVLDKLTGLTEYLTETAAGLPFSTIDKIGMTPVECILLTVAISLLIFFLLNRSMIRIILPLSAFLIFTFAVSLNKTRNLKTNELIVYNNSAQPATGIRTGLTLHLLSVNDSVPKEVLRHTSTIGLSTKLISKNNYPYFFMAGNKKIFITDSLNKSSFNRIKPDILILNGRKPYLETSITAEQLPGEIIISSEAGQGFQLKFKPEELKKKRIWYVKKSGAYDRRLD